MRELFGNRLLIVSIAMVAFYWAIGPLLPKPYMSSIMSLLSVGAGVLMFSRYAEHFFQILFRKLRSETGSHWAIFGASLVALGVIYSGLYALIWIYFEQPIGWAASTTSGFGRGLVAIGFWLMAVSPDTNKIGDGYPYTFWRAIIIMSAILAAFIAGTHYPPLSI